MLIGIRNARVMLFFEFVFYRVRSWIATLPETFDELVPFFVIRSCLKAARSSSLIIQRTSFVQPLFVGLA